jgi:glutathione synthase/RimK-type ligase-like ATP-grasp enzyme
MPMKGAHTELGEASTTNNDEPLSALRQQVISKPQQHQTFGIVAKPYQGSCGDIIEDEELLA